MHVDLGGQRVPFARQYAADVVAAGSRSIEAAPAQQLSAPGNVGVFQIIYAVTVSRFGIAEGPAVAAALLIQTIQVLPTLLIGTLMTHGLMTRDVSSS